MPKRKKTEKDGLMAIMAAQFVEQATDLLADNGDDMQGILEDAETGKLGFSLTGEIDTTEGRPQLKCRLRFSEVHTDERVVQLDDPKQGTFKTIVDASKGQGRKGKAKNRDEAEKEAEDKKGD